MKKPLLIYGAGGFGREVLSLLKALNEWEVIGFADDGVAKGTPVSSLEVKGGIEYVNNYADELHLVIAIGDPVTKKQIVTRINNRRIAYPTVIHPSAILQDPSTIKCGKGTIICAGAVITTDVVLGDFVLVNLNATIGHDVTIGSYSSLMPSVNIAGHAEAGEQVLIGSGACLRNHVMVGDGAVIGMGSVVLENVEAQKVVAGVPAKVIRQ